MASGECKTVHELLRLFERLRELSKPLRILGCGHVSSHSDHIDSPVVRPPYAALFARGNLRLVHNGAETA